MRPVPIRVAAASALLVLACTGCTGESGGVVPATETSGSPAPHTGVPPLHPSVDGYPETEVTLTGAGGGPTRTIPVKVADTRERRSHGLMEVAELPEGTGMLFTYPTDQRGAFWMKDTLVPLDIAFVAADGEVVATFAMQPCESDPCPTYGPDGSFRAALEVPRGWLAEQGFGQGDTITWSRVRPAP